MTRNRAVLLGAFFAFCACGKQFSASNAVGGAAGAISAGGASGSGARGGLANAGGGGAHPPIGGAGGSLSAGGTLGVGGLTTTGGLPGGGSGGVVVDAGEIPPIPTAGLALWLRADRGVVQQKDGSVGQWLDQSGQQMDAIQTGSNVRPKFLATGLNGLPAIDFDGATQFLNLPAGFGDFSNGLSLFVLMQPSDAMACASVVELSNGSEIQDISLGMYQGIWQYEVANDDLIGGAPAVQPQLLVALQRPNLTVDLRQDGMLLGQSNFALPDFGVRQQNFVGRTLYASCGLFPGQISEIVMYSRSVTDKELLTIEGYLQNHWACCGQ